MTKKNDFSEVDAVLTDANALCLALSDLLQSLAELAENNQGGKNNTRILYEMQRQAHTYTALISAVMDRIAEGQQVAKEASD